MNRTEYMAALRRALSVLPEEERASALRYYEEYFDDAGPENEAKVIADLGAPDKVAAQILADYRDIAAVPQPDGTVPNSKPRRRGINPWLLLVLVLLAIPVRCAGGAGIRCSRSTLPAGGGRHPVRHLLCPVGYACQRGDDPWLRSCTVRVRHSGIAADDQAVHTVCAAAVPRFCGRSALADRQDPRPHP